MAETILDGTGRGYEAKVNSNNELATTSVIVLEKNRANENGDAFNINTGSITLTGNNTTSAVFYVKNNEDKDLIIPKIIYILGGSTGGSGDFTIEVLRDPTEGTIVATATDVDIISNRNYGNSNQLAVDAYKGIEGDTFTNGDPSIATIFTSTGIRVGIDVGEIVLPKGSSLGVNVQTQAGNTSLAIMIAVECYLKDNSSN